MARVSQFLLPFGWAFMFSKILSLDWSFGSQKIRRKKRALSVLALRRRQSENIFRYYAYPWSFLSRKERLEFMYNASLVNWRCFSNFVTNNSRRSRYNMPPVDYPDFPIDYGLIVIIDNDTNDSVLTLDVKNGDITLTRPSNKKALALPKTVSFSSPVYCYYEYFFFAKPIELGDGWSIKYQATAYYIENGEEKTKTFIGNFPIYPSWWGGGGGILFYPPLTLIYNLYRLKLDIIYHKIKIRHFFYKLDLYTYNIKGRTEFFYPFPNTSKFGLPLKSYQKGVNVDYTFSTSDPVNNKIVRGFPLIMESILIKNKIIIGSQFPDIVCPLIDKAKDNIKIIVFDWRVFPVVGDSLRRFMTALDLAVKRGVKIKAIVNNDLVKEVVERSGISARRIITKKLIHAKFILIDDRFAIIGSHNFTNSAFEENVEVSVACDLEDEGVVLSDYFNKLYGV